MHNVIPIAFKARETSGNELSLWIAKISGTVVRLHKLLAGDARNEGSDGKDYELENTPETPTPTTEL
jgi:hypothetical protein